MVGVSRTPTSVNLEDDHSEWLDQRNMNRSDFINQLIDQYRSNDGRMEEAIQEFRAEQLLEEATELETESQRKQREAERKRQKAQEYLKANETAEQQTGAELEEARETLEAANTPLDPANPAVQKQAEKVGMTPVELVDELKDGGGE